MTPVTRDKKLYFHIGVTYGKDAELAHLRELGYRIAIIDDMGIVPKHQNFESYHSVFNASYDEITALISTILDASRLELGLFFTMADGSVDLTDKIARDFGRPHISDLRGVSLRDKYLTRKRLETFGHKIDVLQIVESINDISIIEDELFPLIVKPTVSMDSRSVYKVFNQVELEKACVRIFSANETPLLTDHGKVIIEEVYRQPKSALIESHLSGTKYSVEVLVVRGTLRFMGVTRKHRGENDFFYEYADIVGDDGLSDDERLSVRQFVKDIVAANRTHCAILHVEFVKQQNGTFSLIEVNSRLGGGRIPSLYLQAYGIDLLDVFFNLVENGEQEGFQQPKPKQIACSYDFLTGQYGYLKIFAEECFEQPIAWHLNDGDLISRFKTSQFYRLGHVDFIAPDAETLEKKLSYLDSSENRLYKIDKKPSSLLESQTGRMGLSHYIHSRSRKVLTFALMTFVLATTAGLGTLLYYNFENHVELLGRNLSQVLRPHIQTGEVYMLADYVQRFETQRWCKRITITDEQFRVVHSKTKSGLPADYYLNRADPESYEYRFPIESDGYVLGYVLLDRNYVQFLKPFLAVLAAVFLLSYLAYRFLMKRELESVVQRVEGNVEQISTLVETVSEEIERLENEEAVSQRHAERSELTLQREDFKELARLRRSVANIVDVLLQARREIAQKRHLTRLLQKSHDDMRLIRQQKDLEEQKLNDLIGLASQVAHDIKSPLSALSIIANYGEQIPRDATGLLAQAVARITAIVDDIQLRKLENQKQLGHLRGQKGIRQEDLVSMVVSVVNEKRASSGTNRIGLDVQPQAMAMAVPADRSVFMRVLSNLLNNALEAISPDDSVKLTIDAEDGKVVIKIIDDGRGIPASAMARIGERGFSFNKENGTGLGLFHAITSVESWNGKLKIESQENKGTTVTVSLPASKIGPYIDQGIPVGKYKQIIIIDDEPTVHEAWKRKLSAAGWNNIRTFSSLIDFKSWYRQKTDNLSEPRLYLMDYCFKTEAQTGLEVIVELNLEKNSILVTGSHQDFQIRNYCADNNIRMLPKELIPIAPLSA
ncbi:MAG: ATP-grasp domain-containing protein [Deltaproteobacteria bacterium]|nr:ATP-grasp domain-containing protein [Deltaproteobacteria bacterium]